MWVLVAGISCGIRKNSNAMQPKAAERERERELIIRIHTANQATT
jgi:hypothetical protein